MLGTFTFVLLWLEYVIDKSIVSMRDLFQRLNYQGINLNILNSRKATQKRDSLIFKEIIIKLKKTIK